MLEICGFCNLNKCPVSSHWGLPILTSSMTFSVYFLDILHITRPKLASTMEMNFHKKYEGKRFSERRNKNQTLTNFNSRP